MSKCIEECDAIIIGAGSGLSTAAGLTYAGERFEKYFSDFIKKFEFFCYHSGFFTIYSMSRKFPFETQNEEDNP